MYDLIHCCSLGMHCLWTEGLGKGIIIIYNSGTSTVATARIKYSYSHNNNYYDNAVI